MTNSDKKSSIQRVSDSLETVKEKTVSGIRTVDTKINQHETYMVYLLLTIMSLFTAGIRIQPVFMGSFKLFPDTPVFTQPSGYEAYRSIRYAMENFPIPLIADTLPNYPIGGVTQTGQIIDIFLSLFAFAFTIVLPTDQAVTLVLYLMGPISAVLVLLTVYKISKIVFNKNTALIASLIFTILPSQYLQLTSIGAGSRLSIHVLLFTTLLLGVLYLTRSAIQNVIVIETLTQDFTTWNSFTKSTLLVSVLSVLFTTSEPAFVFIYVTIVATILIQHSGFSSIQEGISEAVPISLVVPTIVTLFSVIGMAVVSPQYITLHVSLIAICTLIVGYLALSDRVSAKLSINSRYIVSAGILTAILASAVSVYQFADLQLLQSITQPTGTATYYNTINSILLYDIQTLVLQNFGLFGFVSIIGFLAYQSIVLYRSYHGKINIEGVVLSSVAFTTLAMSIVNITWFAFSSVTVAIFGAYTIFFVADKADLLDLGSTNIKAYHVIILIALIGLFIPMLVVPVNGSAVVQAQSVQPSNPGWATASDQLGKIDENPPVDPYQQPMEQPPKGVIMWGNNEAKTIHALSGQPSTGFKGTSPQFASEYLLAQSEAKANQVENKYGANSNYVVLSWEDVSLRNQMLYMVKKHPSISLQEFYTSVYDAQTRQLAYTVKSETYYNSLATRMYLYNGSRMNKQPVTVTYTQRSIQDQQIPTTFTPIELAKNKHIQTFNSMKKAQQYVNGTLNDSGSGSDSGSTDSGSTTDGNTSNGSGSNTTKKDYPGTRQIGGVGIYPPETIPALQHHRYIASSSQSLIQYPPFMQHAQILSQYTQKLQYSDLLKEDGRVKVFQEVEGVTIKGSGGPPNHTVQIVVALKNEKTGTPFTYVQRVQTDSNGNFTTTLPYATKGTPENFTIKPTQNYQMLSQIRTIAPTGDGSYTLKTNYWYSDEVVITNEQVTSGATVNVKLEKMTREELLKAIKGDGVIQPQPTNESNDSNGSSDSQDTQSSSDSTTGSN